jgi:hypothetical protein
VNQDKLDSPGEGGCLKRVEALDEPCINEVVLVTISGLISCYGDRDISDTAKANFILEEEKDTNFRIISIAHIIATPGVSCSAHFRGRISLYR